MAHWPTIERERHALADLLEGLTPAQWRQQSLCEAWTVHEVVAHLVTPLTLRPADAVAGLVRSGGRIPRLMQVLIEQRRDRSPEELVAVLRRRAGWRVAPPVVGSAGPLTDVMAHRRDIVHPLGLGDDRPPEAWRPVLEFLLSPRSRVGFVRGRPPRLRYVADDLAWSGGEGPEVTGPAAALALALLRRTPWLDELAGPGAATLRDWVRR